MDSNFHSFINLKALSATILYTVSGLVLCDLAHAENLIQSSFGKDPNQMEALKAHGVTVGGWVSMGGT